MPTCPTPTVDDLLADPLIQALMRADHVDPARLRRELARQRPKAPSRPVVRLYA